MSFREELTDYIYRFIMTSALAVFLFLEIYDFADPELITKGNILYLLIISLFLNAFPVLYHKLKFYLIPAFILVIGGIALIAGTENLKLLINSTVFRIFVITLGSFIIFLLADAFMVINLLLSAGLIIYLAIMTVSGSDPHPASPAFVFFFAACFITRFSRNRMKKADAARTRNYMTFLLPFLLSLPLCLILLPKPEEPISWNWAVRLYENVSDKINEIMHDLSLKFSSSGKNARFSVEFGYQKTMSYDNDAENSDPLLEFTPGYGIPGNIYLKGEVFNTFSDGIWSNTIESTADYSAIDAFETYYGLELFDPQAFSSVLRENRLKIRYLDFTSDILFTPAKNILTASAELKDETHVKDEHILFNKTRTYGTEYDISFLQVNYTGRAFKVFITTDLTDQKEAFDTAKYKYLNSLYSDLSFEDLLAYREYIKTNYTSAPVIRDSVKEWLDTVTADAASDYEKLIRIERALSGMTYTLAGGELPDYVDSAGDFINYFIIEKQAGYCVHFATAFCLLARYLGYPSRVVQGYKAPAPDAGTVSVYSNYGHTWPEVYFEGKGWIAFEPTPGMLAERYQGWMSMYKKYSDFDENAFDFSGNIPEAPEPVIDTEYVEDHDESNISGMFILMIVAILFLSLVLLFIATVIAGSIRKKRMGHVKLYALEFKNVLQIIKEFNIKRTSDETLTEFSKKASEGLYALAVKAGFEEYAPKFKDTSYIENYEGVIYGNREVNEQDLSDITAVKDRLLRLLKRRTGAAYPLQWIKIKLFSVLG
ncbi:MAG: transglutaminase-like domain-containing protein [Lachnospiraceae bacterium]|nr:transglutaminase-like domain-containing protein [Lachnospiraceae bacterium]